MTFFFVSVTTPCSDSVSLRLTSDLLVSDVGWHVDNIRILSDDFEPLAEILKTHAGVLDADPPELALEKIRKAGRDLLTDVGEIAGYSGPVGGGTVVQAALGAAGIPTVGLWAEVPHYIAATPNPAAALALVGLVAGALEIEVDTNELEAAAKLHREQVDQAVAEHDEAAEMVAVLERHLDADGDERLPSGEDIAAEIERFLRSQPES